MAARRVTRAGVARSPTIHLQRIAFVPISVEVPADLGFSIKRCDLTMRVRETEGFVVESDEANLGTVDGFQAGGGSGAGGFLLVRAGLFGRRRMMISVGDISEILPNQRRIRLRSTWMVIKA